MECQAAVRWDAGLVERALQLRLVALQERERLWAVGGDLDPRWRILRPVDADLDMAKLCGVETERQARAAIRRLRYRGKGRRHLGGR
jgi:hypothetical protein